MKEKSIKILDCTLRDGGYINDWMFGEKVIQSTLENLGKAEIDYIECGFLKNFKSDKNKTFFHSTDDLKDLIDNKHKYTLMVNFGEYDISNFSKCTFPNLKIRVAFKKHNQQEALIYIKELKELDWDVIANPMNTNMYSYVELLSLIENFNNIRPFGVTIVDTFGNMQENEVEEIFGIFDKNLSKEIALGFHSHNNLQLSFSNTKTLLKMELERDLIIDSCIYGMGRGAGNLCTELITKYLNDNFSTTYQLEPILKIINNNITPFYEQKSWGYSIPYYVAGINNCHPNYASYLLDKGFSDKEISKIIPQINQNEKNIFNKDYIEDLISNIFLTK